MDVTTQVPAGEGTPVRPLFPPFPGPENRRPGFLSVLCVSEDPLFRDRICRNLERDGGVFVEIAVTAEDALHLMSYLFFDVVVTDCISWQGKENGFLRAIRQQGIRIPCICFIRHPHLPAMEEAARLGPSRTIAWDGHMDSRQFGDLLHCIHDMTGGSACNGSRDAERGKRPEKNP